MQEHAEEHLNAVNGLVSFADARLADMQALYVVVEERLQGMAAGQECASCCRLDPRCTHVRPTKPSGPNYLVHPVQMSMSGRNTSRRSI